MTKDDHLTERQFAAAVFTALLSPMMRVLPRATAILAGKWAWLSVLPAVPVLLALAALMASLRRSMAPGEGSAQLFLRVFGRVLGRVLLAVYAAWFLFYAGFILRSGADRLTATVYPHGGPGPFVAVMLGLSLLAALGTLRAAGRTAAVFRGLLLAVLAAVFLLSVPNMEPENLLPLRLGDSRGVLAGALPIVTVGGAAGLFSFLRGYTPPAGRDAMRLLIPPLALFTAAAAALDIVTVGAFGAKLTARLSYPFFTMIRDLSVAGTAQRFEAAVIVLWVFADFTMCTLLLRCGHEALRAVFSLPGAEEGGRTLLQMKNGRWLLWAEAAAAGACALLLPSAAESFRPWMESLVPLAMDLAVFGGFPLLWLVGRLRKKL